MYFAFYIIKVSTYKWATIGSPAKCHSFKWRFAGGPIVNRDCMLAVIAALDRAYNELNSSMFTMFIVPTSQIASLTRSRAGPYIHFYFRHFLILS